MVDRGIAVLIAFIVLAGGAVIVSKRSDTAKVLTSFFTGFSNTLRAAVSPVTGK